MLNYVPVELDNSEQAPASIILNDIYPFQVTVMSLAIEFGTLSLMLLYIMIIASNILMHLGDCYLGLFLLVFFIIAPSDITEGEDEEFEICNFVTAFLLSVAAFVRLTVFVVHVVLPL